MQSVDEYITVVPTHHNHYHVMHMVCGKDEQYSVAHSRVKKTKAEADTVAQEWSRIFKAEIRPPL